MRDEEIGIGDAASDIVILIAPHHEKIGRRQHRDRDANVGEAVRQDCELRGRYRRQFGHMSNRDPAAAAILFGQLADLMDVHRLGRAADIEMQVDVDVVFTREFENSADLAIGVAVVARGAANHLGPAFQRLDQQLVGTWVIRQPVLRKDADFYIDRPTIVGNQRLHGVESAHADRGIHFDLRTHAGRPVEGCTR